jgi:hypothetical protein
MLIDLAEQIGITVRRAPATDGAEHPGGAWVRLRDREMLFLDTSASTADQMNVIVTALRGRKDLEDTFLPPGIRDLLDAAEG